MVLPVFSTLAISMVHYHLFLPIGCLCGALLSSISPLALSLLLYHLLLSNWLSLWYTTIFAWPSGPFLCNTTILYWPTCCFYGTLLSYAGQLAVSSVHYHLLLANLYGTQLSSSGPLAIPRVLYYLLWPLAISFVDY